MGPPVKQEVMVFTFEEGETDQAWVVDDVLHAGREMWNNVKMTRKRGGALVIAYLCNHKTGLGNGVLEGNKDN